MKNINILSLHQNRTKNSITKYSNNGTVLAFQTKDNFYKQILH